MLFFATYMLPFFLPESWRIDPLLRVMIGVILFAGAYMAEVVRGGLQAIPRGQFEGAAALGCELQPLRLVLLRAGILPKRGRRMEAMERRRAAAASRASKQGRKLAERNA